MTTTANEPQVFKPAKTNIIAGCILAGALMFGGVAFARYVYYLDFPPKLDTPEEHRARKIAIGVAGVGGPIGSLILLAWMRRLSSHRLELDHDGFDRYYKGYRDRVHWNDLASVKEVITPQSLPILKLPGASLKTKSHRITLKLKDGNIITLSTNSISDIDGLRNALLHHTEHHETPWDLKDHT